MRQREDPSARRARWLMIIATLGVIAGCNAAPGSSSRACTGFDRGYAKWQVATAPSSHADRATVILADTNFLIALDQATSEAGATSLTGGLQSIAANLRQITAAIGNGDPTHLRQARRRVSVAVGVVRRTCPKV